MSQIIGFILSTGSEIIGALNETESTAESIVLNEPVALVMQQTREGVRGSFLPVAQSNSSVEQLAFPIAHMSCLPFQVSKEVADGYIKAHSKLDLSAAKSGLTLVKP